MTKAKKSAKKKPTAAELRAKTAARRKAHGKYIGAIRHLPIKKKAQVKKVYREKGRVAAIRLARELAA